ncbi:hypothetical protein GJ744_008821 [Endocarpon pusillum]|uniref:Uncharacterized protein n=1 Tax=Endocarpon pusillum TaxID=364733 RepID=A0A8H7ASI6_9EURO|nr:hypothetical protein GJ744_008821 [Endocarpon pusillum]
MPFDKHNECVLIALSRFRESGPPDFKSTEKLAHRDRVGNLGKVPRGPGSVTTVGSRVGDWVDLWVSLTMTVCGLSFDAAVFEHFGTMLMGWMMVDKRVSCSVEWDSNREGDERGDQGEGDGLHVVGFLVFGGGLLACLGSWDVFLFFAGSVQLPEAIEAFRKAEWRLEADAPSPMLAVFKNTDQQLSQAGPEDVPPSTARWDHSQRPDPDAHQEFDYSPDLQNWVRTFGTQEGKSAVWMFNILA